MDNPKETSEIGILAWELSEAIAEDPRVAALAQAETTMENEPEVMRLAYAFDVAQTDYNDLLKYYPAEAPVCQEAQRRLFVAKKALDEHLLVRAYYRCYAEVRKMYDAMQQALFTPFGRHACLQGDET